MSGLTWDEYISAIIDGIDKIRDDTLDLILAAKEGRLRDELAAKNMQLDELRIREIEQVAKRVDYSELQDTLRSSWDDIKSPLMQEVDELGNALSAVDKLKGFLSKLTQKLGPAAAAFSLNDISNALDQNNLELAGEAALGALLAGGLTAGIIMALPELGLAAAFLAVTGVSLGSTLLSDAIVELQNPIFNQFKNDIGAFIEKARWLLADGVYGIHDAVWDFFAQAGILPSRKDPLALDLDGNGIATISANEGIVFDHNKSGIKYGTGWINPNDGWLALDRNGNGKIDSGRELFGDNTIKLDGNFAFHAYDALASFDTNKDGKVDAADAPGDTNSDGWEAGEYWDINNNGEYDEAIDKTFEDLRVWVDANSNAITDGGELRTLSSLGIESIATGKTTGSGADANGNINTFKGNYTKASGEVVDGTRSFNLVENKFYSDYGDGPNIPPDVAALPNMQGSGAVRDLHQAMSLGTAESLALKTIVQAFSSATTRTAQYALIDTLLLQWSRTSEFDDMVERLEGMTTSFRNFQTGQMAEYEYRFALTTGAFWDDTGDMYDERNQQVDLIGDPSDPDYLRTLEAKDHLYVNNPEVLDEQTTAQAGKIQALAKARVLEVFNNAQFFDFFSNIAYSGTDGREVKLVPGMQVTAEIITH